MQVETLKLPTQKLRLGFLSDLSNSKNGNFIFIILILTKGKRKLN